jgi:TonB family protein
MGLRVTTVLAAALLMVPGALVAQPAAPRLTAPYRVGGNIPPPEKIRHVDPQFPDGAGPSRGFVMVEIVVDATGQVSDVRVLRSIPQLDAAVVAAVRQWQYRPTLVNGVAVPVVLTAPVAFGGPAGSVPPVTGGATAVAGTSTSVSLTSWRVPGRAGWEVYELTEDQARSVPAWDPAASYEPPLSAAAALSTAVEFFRQQHPSATGFELHHLMLVNMRGWVYQIQVGSSDAAGAAPPSTVRVFVLMDGSILRPVRTEPLQAR